MFEGLCLFTNHNPNTLAEIMVKPLWHNHKIKLENKSLFYSKISEHNKNFVSDGSECIILLYQLVVN